jgi:hypothetical protein
MNFKKFSKYFEQNKKVFSKDPIERKFKRTIFLDSLKNIIEK